MTAASANVLLMVSSTFSTIATVSLPVGPDLVGVGEGGVLDGGSLSVVLMTW